MMILAAIVVVITAFYSLIGYLVDEIKNLPPSPFPSLPVIGHLYLFLLKKPHHLALSGLGRQHGPVVLLRFRSRRVLHVSSLSAFQDCLTLTTTGDDTVFARRPCPLVGEHTVYNYTSLSRSPYGDHLWCNLRRVAFSEILSSQRLQMLSAVFSYEIKLFVGKLESNSPNTVDMKSTFFEVVLNVMMRMLAGKRYFGVGQENAFREIVMEMFRIGAMTNIVWEFLPSLRKLAGFKGIEKQMQELQAKLDAFMQSMIEEHRNMAGISHEEDENDKTVIQVLLNLRERDPETYKDETIKSLMLDLLIAWIDATAGTMEWAMSLLVNHPEVLEKAQNELDEVVGRGRLVKESDLSKLPYLHGIIKETLRMKPVSPLVIPQESSEECLVGGYHIPIGTMLWIDVHAIQADPQVWSEPETFKPERFISSIGGFEGIADDGFKLMPFGSGRRGCPGEIHLAMKMIGLTLGSLLQCFEWERKSSQEMVDLTEDTGLTMSKAHPLLAKWRSRLNIPSLF